MQDLRKPIVLIGVAVLVCVALGCLLTAGGLVAWRIIRASQSPQALEDRSVLAAERIPAAPTATPVPLAVAVNRLVVIGGDGNLYTMRPDGADRQALTTDASEDRFYAQPAWSPAADRIAWTQITAGEKQTSALLMSHPDGGELSQVDMGEYPPFYLYWSPDGRWLACLSSWSEGLALRTVDANGTGAEPSVIARGQPLYFSWSPDSQHLFAHLSGERLSVVSAQGPEQALEAQPGTFGAPEWSADGQHLLFVERYGETQRLAFADASGAVETGLASLEGTGTFALSPDGRQVAFVDTKVDVLTAAFGPLAVVELATGEVKAVSDHPVLGFFWSPDGSRLAYLTPAEEPDFAPKASLTQVRSPSHLDLWLAWNVWDGTGAYELGVFSPSDTYLAQYLRFFDQYARSSTVWAPDSSAFAFAGMGAGGTAGVWVQPAVPGAKAQYVGDGVYAAWSPR